MELDKDFKTILINEKWLFDYLGCNTESYYSFISYLEFENRFSSNKKEINRMFDIVNLLFKTLLGLILTILVHSILFFKKNNNEFRNNIFITHYSHKIKAIGLKKMLGENISILYVPTFNLFEIRKHYRFYLHDKDVFFSSFGIKEILVVKEAFNHVYEFQKLKRKFNSQDFYFILKSILVYKIYSKFAERLIPSIKSRNWIFDNDKAPCFGSIVTCLNKHDRNTINLQHGSFFAKNKFYLPSHSKYIFCCSEREKKLYLETGVKKDNIFVLGAPIQSFEENQLKNQTRTKLKYEFVLLLTETKTLVNYEAQRRFLTKFKSTSFLIRFRPASKEMDRNNLLPFINPEKHIISEGNSLIEDLSSSKKVISFSLDALFVANRLKKNICLITTPSIAEELRSFDDFTVLSKVEKKDLDKFLIKKLKAYAGKGFEYNFGSNDFHKVQQNFINVLKGI